MMLAVSAAAAGCARSSVALRRVACAPRRWLAVRAFKPDWLPAADGEAETSEEYEEAEGAGGRKRGPRPAPSSAVPPTFEEFESKHMVTYMGVETAEKLVMGDFYVPQQFHTPQSDRVTVGAVTVTDSDPALAGVLTSAAAELGRLPLTEEQRDEWMGMLKQQYARVSNMPEAYKYMTTKLPPKAQPAEQAGRAAQQEAGEEDVTDFAVDYETDYEE